MAGQLEFFGGSQYAGNGRDSSGTTSMQGIQSVTVPVATTIGAERKRNADGGRNLMYSFHGSAGEFDIRRGELLFTTGHKLRDASGVEYVSHVNKGKAPGVWSSFGGMKTDEAPILSGVALTDFQQGPVDRSRTNQANIASAWGGTVEVPCSDPLLVPGEDVMAVLPPTSAAQIKNDAFTLHSIGIDASNRQIATVAGYRPAGKQHCLPMQLLLSATGEKTAYAKFDAAAKTIWELIGSEVVEQKTLDDVARALGGPDSSKLVKALGGGGGGAAMSSALKKAAVVLLGQALFDAQYTTTMRVIGKCAKAPSAGRCPVILNMA